MSAKAGGSLATVLMSIPLAAIPLMAVFGIPEFTPVSASSDGDQRTVRDGSHRDDPVSYRRRASDVLAPRDVGPARRATRDDPGDGDPFNSTIEPGGVDRGLRDAGSGDGAVDTHGEPPVPRPRSLAQLPTDAPVSVTRLESDRDVRSAPSDEAARAVPAAVEASANSRITWRDASRQLQELGITQYHLERGQQHDTFLFVCMFSPGDSPQVTQRFEAEAHEPLAAVQAVLDQINDWLRQRFAHARAAPSVDRAPQGAR
jgi:hypothetical protein